jgi:hypothetical protein
MTQSFPSLQEALGGAKDVTLIEVVWTEILVESSAHGTTAPLCDNGASTASE